MENEKLTLDSFLKPDSEYLSAIPARLLRDPLIKEDVSKFFDAAVYNSRIREWSRPALELNEIFMLNEHANNLLMAPHVRRGLDNLAAAREGGRRRNPAGKDERQASAQEFLEARKAKPSLIQAEFARSCNPPLSVKTL